MDRLTFIDITRKPVVAGMFYPDDARELKSNIDRLLSDAERTSVNGSITALIVPHAGYQYSGFIAAHAYKLLGKERFPSVVVVSPSHREYFDGISVYQGAAYRTPLGDLPIDTELREALLDTKGIIDASFHGHGEEHAVEVQLPFIQRTLGSPRILPIVMGDQRPEYCFHLGETLASALKGKNILLIASTDLSHYYSYETAIAMDKIAIDDIASFDDEGLMSDLENERCEACGGGPTVAVLHAARTLGADIVHILAHCNSGDVTGDLHRVVGYVSAAVVHSS